MNTPATKPAAKAAEHYCKQALSLMEAKQIDPNPENYAIWFSYAQGKNKELVLEIDTLYANKLPYDEHTTRYLYQKFIAQVDAHTKAVDDASLESQKMLQEVLRAIGEFSNDAQDYNKGVDKYLGDLDASMQETGVKNIVMSLMEATRDMKTKSEKMNQKLEESSREIQSLRKNLEQVTQESQRDALTNVLNRKTFEKLADEQMALAKGAGGGELCLLMIDIDHFKRFNDTFGHLLGDEVIKIVARTLTDTLKGRDIVARFGGEEFVAMLPNTPLDAGMKVADIIRTTIASKQLKRKDTGESYGTITVSIGVSRFRTTSDTLPTLIKRADDALYESKRGGRNKVTRES